MNIKFHPQAFQNYDVDQSQSITKGEFRRVIESYCFPLTTEQFEAILNKVSSIYLFKTKN